MKLKLTIILTNDETDEVIARAEKIGWSANRESIFRSAEEELGSIERFAEKEIKNRESIDSEDYMEQIADQQIKVTGHVK